MEFWTGYLLGCLVQFIYDKFFLNLKDNAVSTKGPLIPKTLKFRGQETEIFFKPLTVAGQKSLLHGQSATANSDNKMEMKVDFGNEYNTNLMRVQLTACDDTGRALWPNMNSLQNEEALKLQKLIALAQEAQKEHEADADREVGN